MMPLEFNTFARTTGRLRDGLDALFHLRGLNEVRAQVRNILQKNDRRVERDVVEQHQGLVDLSHIATVGNHRQSILAGQQAHGNVFAHPREAAAIRLHEVERARLHVILENHPVGNVLIGGDA